MGMIANWMLRHQNPTSLVLHLIGIPMTVAAIVFLVVAAISAGGALCWWMAGTLFVLGYALQFIGHAIEGNDAGELILVKKLLGLPYVAIAPPCTDKPGEQDG
jgi:uncharacterized membrane protein YGL010W